MTTPRVSLRMGVAASRLAIADAGVDRRDARLRRRTGRIHPLLRLRFRTEPIPKRAPAADPGQTDAQGGQVLTRGPVHEAFAAPVVHDPKAAPTIPKEPPAPIQEMPPDQKPAGQNIQWIPGYWSWDVSRNDFIWVSGIWREPPPNNQWVPGYWHQVEAGFQWVAGNMDSGQHGHRSKPAVLPAAAAAEPRGRTEFATAVRQRELDARVLVLARVGLRLAARASGRPSSPTGSGCRRTTSGRPAAISSSPGTGTCPVANRGLMFAPVYYPQPVYAQPSFVFTPSISIVGSAVTANLFVQAARTSTSSAISTLRTSSASESRRGSRSRLRRAGRPITTRSSRTTR